MKGCSRFELKTSFYLACGQGLVFCLHIARVLVGCLDFTSAGRAYVAPTTSSFSHPADSSVSNAARTSRRPSTVRAHKLTGTKASRLRLGKKSDVRAVATHQHAIRVRES